MGRKIGLIAVLCLIPILTDRASSQTVSVPPALDAQLVAASSPTATQTQVQTAVDAMFSFVAVNPSVADAFSITSQIVNSQMQWNAGSYPAETEDNVVSAINNLAAAWSLPSYCTTQAAEVRQLHSALVQSFPQFLLGDASTRLFGQPAGTPLVRTSFSPLEATLLFLMMAHQKYSNPQYQMTPTEFTTYKTALANGTTLPTVQDRTAAVNAAVNTATANTSAMTLLQQANNALGTLGVGTGGNQ